MPKVILCHERPSIPVGMGHPPDQHTRKVAIPRMRRRALHPIHFLESRPLDLRCVTPILWDPRKTRLSGAGLLWMSNLFVDLARADQTSFPTTLHSFYTVHTIPHQVVNANLLAWYVFLGGHVEVETFWTVDKSYVVSSSSFLSTHLELYLSVVPCRPSSSTCLKECKMSSQI